MKLTAEETKIVEQIAHSHGADITRKPVGECHYCGEKDAVFTGATEKEVDRHDVACDYCVLHHRI